MLFLLNLVMKYLTLKWYKLKVFILGVFIFKTNRLSLRVINK